MLNQYLHVKPGIAANKEATEQGFLLVKLKSSLWMFYSHHHDLVDL